MHSLAGKPSYPGGHALMDAAERLTALKDAHLYRQLRVIDSAPDHEVLLNGRPVLLFCSNSYLGLGREPEILHAAAQALEEWGTGAGGSRLVSGTLRAHVELEAELARFKGSEAALCFSSGYAANVGTLATLCCSQDHIFSDERNHASIIDGCRLSRAQVVVYAHADLDDLRAKIHAVQPRSGLIVTDSVFSMDGDLAPLPELAELARSHGLTLMVDDAHATGVLGDTGRGSLEHFGLTQTDVPLVMASLSKAIPCEGGAICASRDVCDMLRHTARSHVFSTAQTPATAVAACAALRYILHHPERLVRLRANTAHLRQSLAAYGVVAPGVTPIVPIPVGDEAMAEEVADRLLRNGVFAPCIRYPTVARGAARLRLVLNAAHTLEDIERAAWAVAQSLGTSIRNTKTRSV